MVSSNITVLLHVQESFLLTPHEQTAGTITGILTTTGKKYLWMLRFPGKKQALGSAVKMPAGSLYLLHGAS